MSGVPFGAVLDSVREGSFWMPPDASVTTQFVDPVFYYILGLTTFFFVAIVAVGAYFAIRYRKRSDADRTHPSAGSHTLEAVLAIIPSILMATIFWVGFRGYINLSVPPPDALEIRTVGQKWFWTFEYPNGMVMNTSVENAKLREEAGLETGLVVPIGQPVKLIGHSRDVLHSMFVPAFRIKKDVMPNRYTSIWFEATKTGTYDFFCTEYCGKDHSRMITKVIVKEQADYDAWLEEETKNSAKPKSGSELFAQGGCTACHSLAGVAGAGPALNGLFGRDEALADGTSVKADENYIRESIVNPTAKVVNGYAPVMPPFAGTFSDEELDTLVNYIKNQK
ncbi:MAG: cytochrome c oxidase subunit II [Deltaproteobacteria bacterium]|nr:cytochrome c oxidase subunit II [Deltaproteobacteria bacterium]